ncbi:MAG: UDP-3-O-(3-hydroxymyristoyl)glucosamine N-acyltransferase [Thermodesulfobacteriota bacterium]|nr:UDP-3-O-(3-hydroxymyristoyl)glucosamine N-acyltransferase [Thermodesulfobacteriota bacterium]
MEKTLEDLAELVGGEVSGDGAIRIKGIKGIAEAEKGDITFLTNTKYLPLLKTTKASAVIISPEIKTNLKTPALLSQNPYLAFAKILRLFYQKTYQSLGISKHSFVGKEVTLGEELSIYPFVYIGNRAKIGSRATIFPGAFIGDGVTIGDDSIIYSNVTIRERCTIGSRVILHPGVVIGSDGFGFAKDGNQYFKIPQTGIVKIDDDVEIGANCCIDRATLGKTWIKKGVKLDNLIQIAHNVEIGEHTVSAAQVGISGSVKIGSHVTIGGQVGTVGHIKIGDNVTLTARCGVTRDIAPDQFLGGFPAIPHRKWLKAQAGFLNLPDLRKRIAEIEKEVQILAEELKKRGEENE